jgi:hypothetical protein
MADLNDLTQNVSIHNDTTDADVTTTTDGSKERLDVSVQDNIDVTVTDSESPTRYQLKSDYDATGVSLNTSTDTELYSFTGSGVIDLIAVNSLTSANWEVALSIDGTERIRISMADLGSNLGLTNSAYDIVAETANKQFRYHPIEVGFTTSFTVEAKATVGTPNVKHLVLFRERTASP